MASLVKQFTFGHDVKKADWLIGKGMLVGFPKQAFRSLKAPGTAYDNPLTHKDPQPAKMNDFVHTNDDDGGIHINSGIPNRAFFLTAEALSGILDSSESLEALEPLRALPSRERCVD